MGTEPGADAFGPAGVSVPLAVEPGDILIGKDAELALVHASPTLVELEEISYGYAAAAGANEYMMWLTLAYIRDSELWKTEEIQTFDQYLREWLQELQHRVQVQPYSTRTALLKLAFHRRFVDHLGMDPQMVLTASPSALDTFCRTISAAWDYKTGAATEVSAWARAGLEQLYPEQPLDEQIKQAAQVVMGLPTCGEAKTFIKEHFAAPQEIATDYRFVVVGGHGLPLKLAVNVLVIDTDTGDLQESKWYNHGEVWPFAAVEVAAKRLGASLVEEAPDDAFK